MMRREELVRLSEPELRAILGHPYLGLERNEDGPCKYWFGSKTEESMTGSTAIGGYVECPKGCPECKLLVGGKAPNYVRWKNILEKNKKIIGVE